MHTRHLQHTNNHLYFMHSEEVEAHAETEISSRKNTAEMNTEMVRNSDYILISATATKERRQHQNNRSNRAQQMFLLRVFL